MDQNGASLVEKMKVKKREKREIIALFVEKLD